MNSLIKHSFINSLKEEDSELRFVENNFLTALTGQSTHENLIKKSGLRRILFDKSCLRCILFHKKSGLRHILFKKIIFLISRGCISFQVSYSVYQFISSENDSNSNTEWSQRHNLYQTVITKDLHNKPLVKSNLLRCESHNTISIPEQFIRNNVCQHM